MPHGQHRSRMPVLVEVKHWSLNVRIHFCLAENLEQG
jgi:hypothetical protein